MKTTPSEMRGLAEGMRQRYANTRQEDKAHVHADCLVARADLEDIERGVTTGSTDFRHTQALPLLGGITLLNGKCINVARPYNAEGESIGIHVAFEWRSDPGHEAENGTLIRMYIGREGTGIQAHYEASSQQWYECKSRGNFGKNYASGGNWSSKKVEDPPQIYHTLEAHMDKLRQAKARVEAANLRIMACAQRDGAAAHLRQAESPVYDGQEMVCAGKSDMWNAHADKTEARAELVLAKAGL